MLIKKIAFVQKAHYWSSCYCAIRIECWFMGKKFIWSSPCVNRKSGNVSSIWFRNHEKLYVETIWFRLRVLQKFHASLVGEGRFVNSYVFTQFVRNFEVVLTHGDKWSDFCKRIMVWYTRWGIGCGVSYNMKIP